MEENYLKKSEALIITYGDVQKHLYIKAGMIESQTHTHQNIHFQQPSIYIYTRTRILNYISIYRKKIYYYQLASMSTGKSAKILAQSKPYFAVIFLQFGYAGMAVIAKAALNNGMNHYSFAVYRNITAAVVFAPFAFFFERYIYIYLSACIHVCIYAHVHIYMQHMHKHSRIYRK